VYSIHGTHVVPGMSDEQAARAQRWERPALVVALLVIPYLLLNYADPGGVWGVLVDVLYVGIWLFFLIEVLAMLWLAPDNLAWARRNVLDVTVIVLTAPFEFLPEDFEVIQVLWLLRILDLLPIVHRRVFPVTVIRFAAILWSLVTLGGALAYARLERNSEEPPSLFDGIYWVNTTLSTVGYGDVLPTSPETKLLAMALQISGVVLAAILVAGILPLFDREFAQGFSDAVAQRVQAAVEDVAEDVEDIEADIEAIAHGESRQDRVLAQIARDLSELKAGAGERGEPPGGGNGRGDTS
jgi:voltage-gated potassium channel